MARLLVLMLVLLVMNAARAAESAPAVHDPQLDERVRALAETLRCLVCQNETIAD
ncbi:MAG TPA: cytochrome c-type biogenesis protein CcmH, partial [Burkholderiales bacterium]|nr:cytochrome c-type biogenesis protein CcmH [Burkholderiales bacterium]